MIDREVLKELGIATMGHALAILKLAKRAAMLEGVMFISLIRFLLHCLVSWSFLVLLRDSFLISFFISVSWCPLPIFPKIVNFFFLIW